MLSEELDAVQKAIILEYRECYEDDLSPAKLQRLCYYAQGHALSQGKSLFNEDFQASALGPVVEHLTRHYQSLEWRSIRDPIHSTQEIEQLQDELSSVIRIYGRYDAAGLSTMSKEEGPWRLARQSVQSSQMHSEDSNEINQDAQSQKAKIKPGAFPLISKGSMQAWFSAVKRHEPA